MFTPAIFSLTEQSLHREDGRKLFPQYLRSRDILSRGLKILASRCTNNEPGHSLISYIAWAPSDRSACALAQFGRSLRSQRSKASLGGLRRPWSAYTNFHKLRPVLYLQNQQINPTWTFIYLFICYYYYYLFSREFYSSKNGTWPKHIKTPGPSCSKLTTSLFNDSLKFTSSDTRNMLKFFA